MNPLRRAFFWTHLALGIAAGLLILLMSVTGVMLGFERQMIAWIDGAPRVTPTPAGPLPLDDLLQRAGIARADVASLVVKRAPQEPVTLRLRDDNTAVLLDPYRGDRVSASGTGKGQAFFSGLRRWHRWIGVQGRELRAQMKVITGTANLIFLGLVLSGLYLWWPRHWTRARLRATLVPQLRSSGKARDFNWHNSLGFWSAIPLAFVVATAGFISFQWPGRYLDLALGNAEEKAAARAALKGADTQSSTAPNSAASPSSASSGGARGAERSTATPMVEAALARYVAAATAAHPEWAQLTLTLPREREKTLRVAVAEGNTYRPDQRYTLTLDRAAGDVASASGYADLSASRKIRAWVRFGHTGEVFGLPGQLIATLASAAGVILVWTGFALAWRRLVHWLRARRRRSVPAVLPLPDSAFEPPTALR